MPDTPKALRASFRVFVVRLALISSVIALIPALVAWQSLPSGSFYLGSQFNTDDHMVYAAWIRQAMDGNLLFQNKFAVDTQPGLTVHLYFLVLGWVAKLFAVLGPATAIPLVVTIARIGFSYLFVILLGRLVARLEFSPFVAKLGMLLAVFGAGVGFVFWQPFGRLVGTQGQWAAGLVDGRLPIDVWQPEAFVFPSMLTNSLFMVSLCLIVLVFESLVRAREDSSSVLPGALWMLLLMNIHSYDVLLVTLVFIGVGTTALVNKTLTKPWVVRSLLIGLGAVPAALWFLYVLKQDPVFQARAATLTYSPTFRQVLSGVFVTFGLAVTGLLAAKAGKRQTIGAATIALTALVLFVSSTGYDPDKTYFLGLPQWLVAFAAALTGAALVSGNSIGRALVWNWAAISLVAPYFPQLFQRKLAMGLSIPWAFAGAIGFELIAARLTGDGKHPHSEDPRNARNLAAGLAIALVCATSVYWFQRESLLVRGNVSSTKVQPVFFSSDVLAIVKKLDEVPGRKVVIARPGVPSLDSDFATPYLPDINPVLTGIAGCVTYAGHWSETPNYDERRTKAEGLYRTDNPEVRREILRESGADYIVVPDPGVFNLLPTGDLSDIGETVYSGRQYDLIRVDKAKL